jgi:hypothetical protein
VTGQIVNQFDFGEAIAQHTKKKLIFEGIMSQCYNTVYMRSAKIDSLLCFKMKNDMDKRSIESDTFTNFDIDSYSKFSKIMQIVWDSDGVSQLKEALSQPI